MIEPIVYSAGAIATTLIVYKTIKVCGGAVAGFLIAGPPGAVTGGILAFGLP